MRPAFGHSLVSLLHVDDCVHDRQFIQQAIHRTGSQFWLYGVDSLEAATEFFEFRHKNGEFGHQLPRPDIVLLDYDLGLHTGADFLYWLRVQKKLTSLPVVMYSGSDGTRHIAECYALGANLFLSKPCEFSRVMAIVQALSFCMSFPTPHLGILTRLLEYYPDPQAGQVLVKTS